MCDFAELLRPRKPQPHSITNPPSYTPSHLCRLLHPHTLTPTSPHTHTLQPSVEAEGSLDADSQLSTNDTGHDTLSATFEQLVVQFTHIIKNVSKTYSLHESHRQVVILQLKGFLDEFCNTKGSKKRDIKRRYSQVPAVSDVVGMEVLTQSCDCRLCVNTN